MAEGNWMKLKTISQTGDTLSMSIYAAKSRKCISWPLPQFLTQSRRGNNAHYQFFKLWFRWDGILTSMIEWNWIKLFYDSSDFKVNFGNPKQKPFNFILEINSSRFFAFYPGILISKVDKTTFWMQDQVKCQYLALQNYKTDTSKLWKCDWFTRISEPKILKIQ